MQDAHALDADVRKIGAQIIEESLPARHNGTLNNLRF